MFEKTIACKIVSFLLILLGAGIVAVGSCVFFILYITE